MPFACIVFFSTNVSHAAMDEWIERCENMNERINQKDERVIMTL